MPKIDIQIDSNIIGNLSLDPQDIYAQGGPDFPVLYIRTDFGITPYQQYGQPDGLKPLTCVSMTGEFCSPPERVVARFQHSECVHSSRNDNRMYSNQVTFTIPLDLAEMNSRAALENTNRFSGSRSNRPFSQARVLHETARGLPKLAGVNLHTYTGWGSVTYWNES